MKGPGGGFRLFMSVIQNMIEKISFLYIVGSQKYEIFLVFEAIAISRCYLCTYRVFHRETLFTTEMAAGQGSELVSSTINLNALTEDSKVLL